MRTCAIVVFGGSFISRGYCDPVSLDLTALDSGFSGSWVLKLKSDLEDEFNAARIADLGKK